MSPDHTFNCLKKSLPSSAALANALAVILAVIKWSEQTFPDKIRSRWAELHHDVQSHVSQEFMSGQKKTSMKWPEVYEKNNTLYAKAMQSKEPKALMDALISSFYVDLEPRRQQDYYRLAFNKSAAEHEAYLDAEYTTMTIPQFKTSKSLGEFVKILPVKVTELLRESLLAQPRTHVFVGRDGNKYKTIRPEHEAEDGTFKTTRFS
jgi:hypothetical protein